MPKRKRRLSEAEVSEISVLMDKSPMNNKPTIRQLARRFGCSRASIIKSLGGWDGIQRNRPQVEPKQRLIDRGLSSPVAIEPFTVDISKELNRG